jgi:uncharacterized protein
MASRAVIEEFLSHEHLAFVGVSRDSKQFSASVYRELRDRGYGLVPVNPNADEVEGDRCFHDVRDVPDGIEGAIVMVPAEQSASVVKGCIDKGIPRVWLHKGAGPSSVSDEAIALCEQHGVAVVDGACPLMFTEPVAWFHRVHRFGRKLTGGLKA